MGRAYRVTIYNQHAACGISATGRTRREAFNRAVFKAGEPFLRYGGDKLTTLRNLFAGAMERNRTASYVCTSSPVGCAVEWTRNDSWRWRG